MLHPLVGRLADILLEAGMNNHLFADSFESRALLNGFVARSASRSASAACTQALIHFADETAKGLGEVILHVRRRRHAILNQSARDSVTSAANK